MHLSICRQSLVITACCFKYQEGTLEIHMQWSLPFSSFDCRKLPPWTYFLLRKHRGTVLCDAGKAKTTQVVISVAIVIQAITVPKAL